MPVRLGLVDVSAHWWIEQSLARCYIWRRTRILINIARRSGRSTRPRIVEDFRYSKKSFPETRSGKDFAKMNRLRIYGEGEVLTLTVVSVFSVFVAGDGFTIVVLVSFFSVLSAGGLFTVVSFCSQAASKARPANRQMYFFIQVDRIREPIQSFLRRRSRRSGRRRCFGRAGGCSRFR
jgi:hypothetical protein